jgi:HNH endonuclease
MDQITQNNSSSEDLLIKVWKQAPDRKWAEQFLDLARDLLEYVGLDERDPRVCISLKDRRFRININRRSVLRAFKKSMPVTAFMLPFDVDEKDELEKKSKQDFWFKNSPGETLEPPLYLDFEGYPQEILSVKQLDDWKKACKLEVNRARSSPYRKYHDSLAYRCIVDLEYRELILNQVDFGSSAKNRKKSIQKNDQTQDIQKIEKIAYEIEEQGYFDPKNVIDTRQRVEREIAQRQGQPKFRKALLQIYNCKCAITGFDAQEALEAAHIDSYKGDQTNNLNNGLLLRCDIHTLFDLYRITIHPESYQVIISQKLHQTSYQVLHNRKVNLPSQGTISKEALEKHYAEFLKREQKNQ